MVFLSRLSRCSEAKADGGGTAKPGGGIIPPGEVIGTKEKP